jgi:two-component system, sensor histidine kinase
MDVMLPGMDGLAVTKAIRKLPPPFCAPRIIALTANVQEHDRKVCREAGMDDFLAKPVTRAQFAAKLGVTPAASKQIPPVTLQAEPAPAESAVFDEKVYAELANALGPDDIQMVLKQFLFDANRRLAAMQRAASKGDSVCVVLEAHTAKSSAANLGFLRFSDLAERLEYDASKLTATELNARITELAGQFAEIEKVAAVLRSGKALASVA